MFGVGLSDIDVFDFKSDKKFDLIIDDSDKDPNIRIITFNNFVDNLIDDGYYVIEGLLDSDFLIFDVKPIEFTFLLILVIA